MQYMAQLGCTARNPILKIFCEDDCLVRVSEVSCVRSFKQYKLIIQKMATIYLANVYHCIKSSTCILVYYVVKVHYVHVSAPQRCRTSGHWGLRGSEWWRRCGLEPNELPIQSHVEQNENTEPEHEGFYMQLTHLSPVLDVYVLISYTVFGPH